MYVWSVSSYASRGLLYSAFAALRPTDADPGPFMTNLRRFSKEVKKEIQLATTRSVVQDNQQQIVERDAAARFRQSAMNFFYKAERANGKARQWQVDVDSKEASMLVSSSSK